MRRYGINALGIVMACPLFFYAGCAGDGSGSSDEDGTTETGTTGDGDGDGDGDVGDGDGDLDPVCGDGVQESGEDCDMGDANSDAGECTLDCKLNVCGDGKQWEGVELCDGGLDDPTDDCTDACTPACALEWETTLDVQGVGYVVQGVASGPTENVAVVGRHSAQNNPYDAFITLLDPSGAEIWSVTILEPGKDRELRGVAFLPDGDLIVAGRSEADDSDLWYARYDGDDGSEVWSHTVDGPAVEFGDGDGDSDWDAGMGVAVNEDVVIITGRLAVDSERREGWVRRVSADDGLEAWTLLYGGPSDVGPVDLTSVSAAIDDDGNVYVASSVRTDRLDAHLIKLSADGSSIAWDVSPGAQGPDWSRAAGVSVDPSGNVVWGVSGTGGPAPPIWVHRYDPDGQEQGVFTQAQLQLPDANYALEGVHADMDGGVSLGGWITYLDDDDSIDGIVAWAARISADFELLCENSVGDLENQTRSWTSDGTSAGDPILGGVKLADGKAQFEFGKPWVARFDGG